METLYVEGVITAKTLLHHGGDNKTGIVVPFRKTDVLVGGEVIKVPFISGNAYRGLLRRYALKGFFASLGYQIKSPHLFYILSGGALTAVDGKDSGTLNLEIRRQIRKYFMPFNIFGGALGNQLLSGKISVDMAWPICREMNEILPLQGQLSYWDLLTEHFETRRKETEVPKDIEANMGKKGKEPTIQMKVQFECLIPGTQLYHKFALMDMSDVEKSFFAYVMELYKSRAILGGKSATGMGQVEVNYPSLNWTSELYLKWLDENKPGILNLLEMLDRVKPLKADQTPLFEKVGDKPIEPDLSDCADGDVED